MTSATPLTRIDAEPNRIGLASWYTAGRTDGFGDRLLMFDNSGGASLELLRFRPELAREPGFESLLRQRVQRLSTFRSPSFATIRAVEHLDNDEGLALVSTYTPGRRLSELLESGRASDGLHPAFVSWLVQELTPLLASLQAHGYDIVHGSLTLDRIVLTQEGRVVIVEHALGSAMRGLEWSPNRLWREFGVVARPTSRGEACLDARGDILQLGVNALSLLLGRRVTLLDVQQQLPILLDEFCALPSARDSHFTSPLRTWLERALQTHAQPYGSAAEAREGIRELPAQAVSSLPALLTSVSVGMPPPMGDPGIVEPHATVEKAVLEPVGVASVKPSDTEPSHTVSSDAVPPDARLADAPHAESAHAQAAQAGASPVIAEPASAGYASTPGGDAFGTDALIVDPEPSRLSRDRRTVESRHDPVVLEPFRDNHTGASPAPAVATASAPNVNLVPFLPPAAAEVATVEHRMLEVVRTEDARPALFTSPTSPETPSSTDTPMKRWLVAGLAAIAIVEAVVIGTMAYRRPALATAAVAGTLAVTVESGEPGATVFVNNQVAGTTPLNLTIDESTRSIRLTNSPPQAAQAVAPAATTPVAAAQAPRPRASGVRFTSAIPLQVLEGNRVLGASGESPVPLQAGTHQLDLVNDDLGFRTRQSVTVAAGETASFTVTTPLGRLSLNAQPWAQVLVDQNAVGETPIANLAVPIGQHEVTFRHPQLGEWKETVTVRADRVTRLSTTFGR